MDKRKLQVPREHKHMISVIGGLPDFSLFLWTDPQKSAFENRKEYWHLIGQMIDYFQLKQDGFKPPNPLEEQQIHPGWKKFIKVISVYDFATLNLMIDQFETIKALAVKEGRNFSFNNARELFTQRCRELANSEVVEEIGARGVNNGFSMTKQREGMTELKTFFSGNLPSDEEEEILAGCRTHKEWCIFWMFPVWKAVYESNPSKSLKRSWDDFLDAYNDVLKLFKKGYSSPDGVKLLSSKWSAGHCFDPKTGRSLSYEQINIS